MRRRTIDRVAGACAAALVAAGAAMAAAPPVELTDEGRTIVYRLQAGDTPADIARAFGLDEAALAALLEAHGASDWRRVRAGATWRIPNPLAARLDRLAAQVADAEARRDAAEGRAATLVAELATARAAVTMDAAQRERLARVETWWRGAVATGAVLGLGLLAALAFLGRAQRGAQRAVRWARGLTTELEERRRAVLAERQQAARRLVELEERVRRFELSEAAAAAHVRLLERQG